MPRGHPRLSASTNLKKVPFGALAISRMAAGDSNPQKRRHPFGRLLSSQTYYSCLHLRRLVPTDLAFCCERAVVDATAQAIKLHKGAIQWDSGPAPSSSATRS